MACDASFLKHYHTPVIHFGTLHFKNEETLYYSAGPISRTDDVPDSYYISLLVLKKCLIRSAHLCLH